MLPLPLTMRLPSGPKATLVTSVCVAFESEKCPALSGVPDFHRGVIAAAGDTFAIGTEGHAVTLAVCP